MEKQFTMHTCEVSQSGCVISRMCIIAVANAASVAVLYLGQVLVKVITHEFPESATCLALIPGATFAGYAIGVSCVAFGRNKVSLSISGHLGMLAASLCIAALAPSLIFLATASFTIGAGAAVAQRLIAAAGQLGGASRGGSFIGKTISLALLAVLAVRMAGDIVAVLINWRLIYLIASAIVTVIGLMTYISGISSGFFLINPRLKSISSPKSIRFIWHSSALVRWATFQHGALFLAFNLAWMTLLVEVPVRERAVVVFGAGGCGVLAALLSGYCIDRFPRRDLARLAAAAVTIASTFLLPFAYQSDPGLVRLLLLLLGMALLDAGLQVALVANQARVQNLFPVARAKLSALLTVSGSLGGAIGSGVGYWLWQRFGWQAAISMTAMSSFLGYCFAARARAHRPNNYIGAAKASCPIPYATAQLALRQSTQPSYLDVSTG